jgi:hypothetical protein
LNVFNLGAYFGVAPYPLPPKQSLVVGALGSGNAFMVIIDIAPHFFSVGCILLLTAPSQLGYAFCIPIIRHLYSSRKLLSHQILKLPPKPPETRWVLWIRDAPSPVALDNRYTMIGLEHLMAKCWIDVIEISTKHIINNYVIWKFFFIVVTEALCVYRRSDDGAEQNLPHCENIRHIFKIFVPETEVHTRTIHCIASPIGTPALAKNQGISQVVLKVQELSVNATSCWTRSTKHFS